MIEAVGDRGFAVAGNGVKLKTDMLASVADCGVIMVVLNGAGVNGLFRFRPFHGDKDRLRILEIVVRNRKVPDRVFAFLQEERSVSVCIPGFQYVAFRIRKLQSRPGDRRARFVRNGYGNGFFEFGCLIRLTAVCKNRTADGKQQHKRQDNSKRFFHGNAPLFSYSQIIGQDHPITCIIIQSQQHYKGTIAKQYMICGFAGRFRAEYRKNQNRPGVRAALIRIEGGNDKEESLLINRSAGGVTRFPFDGFSINRKCVKNALSM